MSEKRKSLLAYHLGKYLPAPKTTVSVSSLAMRYGLSVFEGIRGYQQKDGSVRAFMLDEHILRLRWSLRQMGLPDPHIDQIPQIIDTLLDKNQLQEDVYIRPSVHAVNPGDLNIKPVSGMTVSISRMGRKKWLNENLGIRATVSAIRKLPQDSFPSSVKCVAAYANTFIASILAKEAGFDVPLLLNHAGYLTEAPTAALFIVRQGTLTYSPLTDGVLPSVTAHVLRELARRDGIALREQHLRVEDLVTADESFLCGTGLEIASIASLDGRAIGDFSKRDVTQHLTKAYFKLVRGETEFTGAPYGI